MAFSLPVFTSKLDLFLRNRKYIYCFLSRYLEDRFGSLTRLLASLAWTIQMTLYMGIVLYAPSLALSAVTGLSFTGSVISIGLVCTFYSTLGGMKAVLMTDVFQSFLMFAAIYAVIGIIYGFFII